MDALKETAKNIFDYILGSAGGTLKIKSANSIEKFVELINNFSANIWSYPVVEAILNAVTRIGIIVFVFSLIFLISDVGIQIESVDFKTIFVTISKAVLYVFTVRYLGVLIFSLSDLFVEKFSFKIETDGLMEIIERTSFSLFTSIIIDIIAFIFLCLCYYRVSCMVVHLISSILYIPFIVRGDTQKIAEWVTIAVSISITYIIQFTSVYIGLSLLLKGETAFGIIFIITSFVAGPALKQFGYQTGAKGGISGVGRAAMATARAAKLLF